MRKFFFTALLFLICCTGVFAAKIPVEVQEYIYQRFPSADIRFDGVIILPDNTIYLPLYPALFSDINKLKIKETYPENQDLRQKPDVIIFNNDFVLLKVLTDGEGHRTVLHMVTPPLQVRTGLLPQDMLVPSGLIIPENIKGIIGNLKIDTKREDMIRIENKDSYEEFLSESEPDVPQSLINQLKNKILFVTTNYSKNIQVVEPARAVPSYSLAQKSIPIDVKAVNNGKFLLVTTYDRPFVDVISVADSRFIKQINLTSNPEEILIDEVNEKAYITSPLAKLLYVDKLKNEIWVIELNKGYELVDVGQFPNVSDIVFTNNKLYISSRTKSRIAVIDYSTLGLINEFTTVNKPIAMLLQDKTLYVLGAQNNVIQKIDTSNENVFDTIELGTEGFSSGFNRIEGTNLAVVTDLKNNKYSIIDLAKGKLLKTYSVNVPIKDVIITNKVELFD